jgi:3-ketosteroid 9alpha-monooxygenase subunit A
MKSGAEYKTYLGGTMAKTADYGLGEFPFPRGWLMVAASDRLTAVPAEARFFGQDVVLYRGASGRPVMLDAYCPHMGAHLAVGPTGASAQHSMQVEGDMIRCPNHGWLFGPDGRCKRIPYSPMEIPATLGVRSWRLGERAGCVFVWHDAEGGEPTYELPQFAEWSDPRWIRWTIDEVDEMDVHPIELAEHGVDRIHLANVHGADRVIGHKVTFDRHSATTTSVTSSKLSQDSESVFTAHSRYTGPALLLAEIEGERPAILLFCHTPVDDGRVRAFHGVTMRAKGDEVTEEDRTAHRMLCELSLFQFNQDMAIFKRKKPTLRAVQIPGDGPFRRYRQWYRQFYSPRKDVDAIQRDANGVIETNTHYDAPWISAAAI